MMMTDEYVGVVHAQCRHTHPQQCTYSLDDRNSVGVLMLLAPVHCNPLFGRTVRCYCVFMLSHCLHIVVHVVLLL